MLGGYKTDWFGFGIGGTEEDLLLLLDDSNALEGDRADAAVALGRLPAISPLAALKVRELLSDANDQVRVGAAHAVSTFEILAAEEATAKLLDDASSAVRTQAIRTLMKLNPNRWIDRVAARLADSDQEVADTAYFQLKELGKLDRAELLQLVSTRITAAFATSPRTRSPGSRRMNHC